MQGTDPAAVAASTAQGWAYTLNTVARPAPEHLEAAQEALTALQLVTGGHRWASVADTLSEALTAARLRVDGGRPPGDITIAELRGALDELADLGLGARPVQLDGALAQAVRDDGALARITELEEELEKAIEREDAEREARARTDAELRRQLELRDRFERERGQAQRDLKAAHAGHTAAIAATREDSRRAGYRWTLAQLGMNAPGFDQMGADELREEATTVVARTLAEAQALGLVVKELARAERLLGQDYDGSPSMLHTLPGPDRSTELAAQVVRLADRARRAALERQTELEDQLAELRPDMDLATVRAERDMLTKARDAQATELRALRAELTAARDDRDAAISAPHPAEAELERWTGAALELIRLMEPGHYTGTDGTELRAALIAAVRRQLDRVEAIGQRLGREEQISAEQRRRAEMAEARVADLEEALAAERSERSEPSPDQWVGVLRERDRQRERITTLESERDRLRRRVTELAAE